MMQIIQLKGKDKHLYRLLAPLVMDPQVIRANNNYPYKTDENYVWYVALEDNEVTGFVPVEEKRGKRCAINNYYVNADGEKRQEVLSQLLSAILKDYLPGDWLLNSVTLTQDKETFEKFEFISLDMKWTRYVKMYR